MSECKKCRTLFVDALYKELKPEKKGFLESHIQDCPKCQSEFNEMSSTLKILNKRVRTEPKPDFWEGYWGRLADRMEKEKVSESKNMKWWNTLVRTLQHSPRWAYQATAAICLVITGIFIGRALFSPDLLKIQQISPSRSIAQKERGTDLIQRTQDYLERSKLMLLAIINFDSETEDSYALNLPYQQQVSRELVLEAGWLKNELAESRQKLLQELIADLEVILLQIANLESNPDTSTIEMVKNGVKSRRILLKINLAEIRKSINKGNKTTSF